MIFSPYWAKYTYFLSNCSRTRTLGDLISKLRLKVSPFFFKNLATKVCQVFIQKFPFTLGVQEFIFKFKVMIFTCVMNYLHEALINFYLCFEFTSVLIEWAFTHLNGIMYCHVKSLTHGFCIIIILLSHDLPFPMLKFMTPMCSMKCLNIEFWAMILCYGFLKTSYVLIVILFSIGRLRTPDTYLFT